MENARPQEYPGYSWCIPGVEGQKIVLDYLLGRWVVDGHVLFLPVLGRNRISIKALPEVGSEATTCHFTCPPPEPDIHRGAIGSWVGGRPRAIFTCPRPEPDSRRVATGSWAGAATCHFYLSSAGTGYPSRRHRKLGGGRPRATHLRDRKLPGRRVSPRKLCTISGPESTQEIHVLILSNRRRLSSV